MNAERLRAVLTHVEDHPKQFDTTIWAEARPSGIAADIAGRALLLSGWTLTGDNEFRSPDGRYEIHRPEEIEEAAVDVLGLNDDEYWDGSDLDRLFDLPADKAVARLRELAGEAERVIVNG